MEVECSSYSLHISILLLASKTGEANFFVKATVIYYPDEPVADMVYLFDVNWVKVSKPTKFLINLSMIPSHLGPGNRAQNGC